MSLDAIVFRWGKEALPFLEDSLGKNIPKFKQLQRLKNKGLLDFGKKSTKKNILNEIFPKIKKDVCDYLEIKENLISPAIIKPYSIFPSINIATKVTYPISSLLFAEGCLFAGLNAPFYFTAAAFALSLGTFYIALKGHAKDIVYGNMYTLTDQHINIRKQKELKTQLTLTHEYIHHVQNNFGLYDDYERISRIFNEGHARGATRQLSKKYAEAEDNPAFKFDTLEFLVAELKSFYIWLCDLENTAPRRSLIRSFKTSYDKIEAYKRRKTGLPSPHAMGNTVFYYFEQFLGDKLYKDYLISDLFKCLKINQKEGGDAETFMPKGINLLTI